MIFLGLDGLAEPLAGRSVPSPHSRLVTANSVSRLWTQPRSCRTVPLWR